MSLQNEQSFIKAKKQNDCLAVELHDASKIRHSITINKSPEQVFAFWRNFYNLPLFMKDLESVEVLSPTLSRWTVALANETFVSWEAEIIAEIPGEMISWQSTAESDVHQAGSVWFLQPPQGQGCIVKLQMAYTLPGGKVVELVTKLMGEDPDTLVRVNLRRLKALLETGEIPTIQGQASGRDEDLLPTEHH